MQLTMTVLRCPDAVAPETRSVAGGEFSVGRGPGVDWVLPDPERLLSKRHFAVAFRAGVWQLADTSTNGTFLNREGDPIGTGDVRNLRDGDRLRAWRLRNRGAAGGRGGAPGGGVRRQPLRRSVRHGPVRACPAGTQSVRRTGSSKFAYRAQLGAVAARFRSAGAGAPRDAVPRSHPGGQFSGGAGCIQPVAPSRPDAAAFGRRHSR